MDSLRFGNLLLQTKEGGLSFRAIGSTVSLADVDADDIQVIMQFMKSYLEDHANRRSAFRLNLTELQAEDYRRFQVSVLSEAGRVDVRPVDFSLTGMLVEAEQFMADVGKDVILSLRFASHFTIISASVIRSNHANRRIALHFPDVYLPDGSIDPPIELVDIFQALESLWLDNNLNLQWGVA